MSNLSIVIFSASFAIAFGFQSFAPGGYQFPGSNGANIPSTPGINGGNDRGTWNIGVNKDKGRGPQISAEGRGNVYTSPGGNWQVDAGGRWEAGRGRKPSYGADISVQGRWRRSADPYAPGGYQFPGNNGGRIPSTPGINGGNDRGTWNVGVNKDKGRGPQIHAEGRGNVYTSPNGKVRVDAGGRWEAGRGRKPSYGGDINVQGRWRRSADPRDSRPIRPRPTIPRPIYRPRPIRPRPIRPRRSISVTREPNLGQSPTDTVQGNVKVWESNDGNARIDAFGNAQKRNGQTDYGGGITYTRKFGEDRGSISLTGEKARGQSPTYTAQGNVKVWESRDESGRIDAFANAQRRDGRNDFGGGVTYTRKFGDDRGSISLTGEKPLWQNPTYTAQGNAKLWESRDGNKRLDAYANAQRSNGRTDYGGGINYLWRFKREAADEFQSDPEDEPSYGEEISAHKRLARSADPYFPNGNQFRWNNGPTFPKGVNVWESKDGKSRVGIYGRGERTGQRQTGPINYEGGLIFSRDFRKKREVVDDFQSEPEDESSFGEEISAHERLTRSADPGEPGDRGSISVTREQTRGQRPTYTAQGNVKVWESRDRNGRIDAYANGQRRNGRTDYGGGITYTRKFRREVEDESELEPEGDDVSV